MKKRMASTDRLKIVNLNLMNKNENEEENKIIEESPHQLTQAVIHHSLLNGGLNTASHQHPPKPRQVVPPMQQVVGSPHVQNQPEKQTSSVQELESYLKDLNDVRRRHQGWSLRSAQNIEGYLYGYHQLQAQTHTEREEAKQVLQ